MSEAMTIIKTDTGDIKLSPKIIKDYLVRGGGNVSNQEVMLFLSLCKFQKLNPFLNEAYLVKFGNQQANIIVGKETFTKRAFNNPKFKGHKAGIIIQRDKEILEIEGSFKLKDDILLGGWAEIHLADRTPFKHTVSLDEYDKKQSTWKQIPCTMIRKVALVQALREAFPELFQGMYSPEEMPVDNNLVDNFDKVEVPKQCIVEVEEQQKEETTVVVEAEIVEEEKETSTKDETLITDKQVTKLYELAHGDNDLVKEIYSDYNYASSKDIRVCDYEKICSEIEASVK